MSNTQTRILSAIVLVIIIIVSALLGQKGILGLIMVCGVLFVDEFMLNFLALKRQSLSYILSQLCFILGFTFFNFVDFSYGYFKAINQLAIIFHIILLVYLFVENMQSSRFLSFLKSISLFMGLIILIPFCSLSFIVHSKQWILLVFLLLTFNISVDTGAWFFGRKYGKKKLWPTISPNKTINGAIGGSLFAVLVAALISLYAFGKISMGIIVSFLILSALAQLGDLIESKFKRQVGIKDSSNLIPGHGGIYDRLDSLIFVSPFFVLVVQLFY